MKVRHFMMWWTILSILFVAFIAVRHENDLVPIRAGLRPSSLFSRRTKEKGRSCAHLV